MNRCRLPINSIIDKNIAWIGIAVAVKIKLKKTSAAASEAMKIICFY